MTDETKPVSKKSWLHRSSTHKGKFKGNTIILLIILGFVALIWAITMIKVAEWG